MYPKMNNTLIKSVFKSTGDLQKSFTENSDLQFRFCPFKIILGAINSTETGNKGPTSVPNDFNTFSKIFTGREAILAVWKNSFDLIEPDLSVGVNAVGKKVLKIGDVFYGNIVSDQLGITYSANPANANFIQEQAIKNVVINIPAQDKNFDFINNILDNMYHLYMIPEINAVKNADSTYRVDRQWYYIETASKVYNNDTKELAYIQATFSSLNDKLATSGLAINQYVQVGAVGEPVAIPSMDANKEIILDTDYLSPRPVTHCQVTFYGTVGKIAIGLWGRRINKNDGQTITMNPTHLIFPLNYQASTFDPVSFNALPETNYVLTVGAKSTVDTYQQWQEVVAPMYDDGATKTFEGHILTDIEKTTNTNKLDETGKYLPYWDKKFLNVTDLDTDKFDVNGNPYFVYFNKENKNYVGNKDGYILNDLSFKSLPNLNALMYFLYNALNEIPLSVRETTKVQLNTIPIFGSFFNFFTGGVNIGFKEVSNLIIPKFNVVNFFMSAELYKFYTTVLYSKQTEKNIMPYDIFRNGTPDELPAILGTTSHMTSWTFNLTDTMKLQTFNINTGNKVDTLNSNLVNLSQINPNNNQQVYLLPDVNNFQILDSTFTNKEYQGFYIDMIDILVQGKCNFKLTFYSIPNDYEGAVSDDYSIWAGTYQTVGKATGNIRLIKNNFVLANNTYSFKNKYNYPKQVNPPPPQNVINPIVEYLTDQQWQLNHFVKQNYFYSGNYYSMHPQTNDSSNNYQIEYSLSFKSYGYSSLESILKDYSTLTFNYSGMIDYSSSFAGSTPAHNTVYLTEPIVINLDDLKLVKMNEYKKIFAEFENDKSPPVYIINTEYTDISNNYKFNFGNNRYVTSINNQFKTIDVSDTTQVQKPFPHTGIVFFKFYHASHGMSINKRTNHLCAY